MLFQTAKPATMKQAAVARPINDADVQAFLKRQQVAQVALQQKVPTQIIAGTQLQQVRAASVRVLYPILITIPNDLLKYVR